MMVPVALGLPNFMLRKSIVTLGGAGAVGIIGKLVNGLVLWGIATAIQSMWGGLVGHLAILMAFGRVLTRQMRAQGPARSC